MPLDFRFGDALITILCVIAVFAPIAMVLVLAVTIAALLCGACLFAVYGAYQLCVYAANFLMWSLKFEAAESKSDKALSGAD